MKLKTILEMPHAEYNSPNFGFVDFRMEKYKLPKEKIHQLMVSFHEKGVIGKSSLINGESFFFNSNETRKATEEEINKLPHLPENWEEYLLNIQ